MMGQARICSACGETKPLDGFYVNSRTGRPLSRCKECMKKCARERYSVLSDNHDWVKRERERCRRKYIGLRDRGVYVTARSTWPGNGNVSRILRRLGYDTEGKEAHHWSLAHPFSVILMSRRANRRIHQHLSSAGGAFYSDGGMRIETEEQAVSYYQNILSSYGISETLKVINIR